MDLSGNSKSLLPKVSIQIPTYNNDKYIHQSIESCIHQEYPFLQIAVFDDNSKDETIEKINQFRAHKVEIFTNETNLGRVLNYKKAWKWGKSSDWFINLDGDDYYTDKTWINDFMSLLLTSKKDISLIQADFLLYVPLSDLNPIEKLNDNTYVISGYEYVYHVIKNYSFSHLATIFRTKTSIEIEAYSDDCIYCDLFTGLKIASKSNVMVSNRKVGEWRVHQFNSSANIDLRPEKIKNELAFYKFFEFLETVFSFHQVSNIVKVYENREWNRKINKLSKKGKTFEILKLILQERTFFLTNFKHILKSLIN